MRALLTLQSTGQAMTLTVSAANASRRVGSNSPADSMR